MNAKKVLAMILATSMVVGSSMTVLAADGEGKTTGTGEMEGYVTTDVFQVELPVIAENDTTFDFIMDPQNLIKETDKAKYGDSATFEDGANVFFAQVSDSSFYEDESGLYVNTGADITYYDADGTEYSGSTYVLATALYSDATGTVADTSSMTKYSPVTSYKSSSTILTVTNKSSVAAEITVKATLSDYGDVVISGSNTFETTDEAAKLYLALVDTEDSATTAVLAANEDGSVTAELTNTMSAAAEGAYEYSYDSATGEYGYTIADDATDDDFDTYSFYMTGAANSYGDWSAINSAKTQPNVEVVWTVTDPTVTESAPSVATTEYIMTSGSAVEITVDLGAGDLAATGISSITYTNSSGAAKTLDTSNYSLEGNTLTFTSSYIASVISAGVTSRAYTITFDDDAATAVSVTLKTA